MRVEYALCGQVSLSTGVASMQNDQHVEDYWHYQNILADLYAPSDEERCQMDKKWKRHQRANKIGKGCIIAYAVLSPFVALAMPSWFLWIWVLPMIFVFLVIPIISAFD